MIFTILKIIGIIIVAIIFIVIVFILVPLTYRFNMSFKNKEFKVELKYSILSFDAFVDFSNLKSLRYKATVFGKTIADSTVKKETKKKINGKNIGDTDFIENKDLENEINADDKVFLDLFKRSKTYSKELKKKEKAFKKFDKDEKERKTIKENIDAFIDNFKSKLPINMIDVAKLIAHEAVDFFRYIAPKKVKIKMDVGFDDPYNTGLFLAILSPLYALYGDTINVKPEFDKKKLEGELIASGRPQIIFMALPAVRLLLNKRFRDIIWS